MHHIILGLGSNQGDREAYLCRAVAALEMHPHVQLREARMACLRETPALLPEGAPPHWNTPFLNTACAGYSAVTPEALLHAVKDIEKMLGRIDRGRWGPREIDIDILAHGETVVVSPTLTIPHPEMLKRDFVLMPLAELLPEWRYPVPGVDFNKTARELCACLKTPKE